MLAGTYKPSDAPVTARIGFDHDVLSERAAFAADVVQDRTLTIECDGTAWVVAERRNGGAGHLQIITGDMSVIAEGLAIMRHLMGLKSTRSIITWVNDDEPLANIGVLVVAGLKRALKKEGWSLDIRGHVWMMERV